MSSVIKFGTSGWRAIIADEFTFANVRLAVAAIAEHARGVNPKPTLIVGYDTRFLSEDFARTAAEILREHGVLPAPPQPDGAAAIICDAGIPVPAPLL